ncbi:MAG: hypothetical protein F6K10_23750, partial [Moorea sp. SIO2B7]|nr:hypothetical protein [Moorena sp. SIO2B7]
QSLKQSKVKQTQSQAIKQPQSKPSKQSKVKQTQSQAIKQPQSKLNLSQPQTIKQPKGKPSQPPILKQSKGKQTKRQPLKQTKPNLRKSKPIRVAVSKSSQIPNRTRKPKRPVIPVPLQQEPIVTILSPDELTPLDQREPNLADMMDLRKHRSLSSVMRGL